MNIIINKYYTILKKNILKIAITIIFIGFSPKTINILSNTTGGNTVFSDSVVMLSQLVSVVLLITVMKMYANSCYKNN